MWIPQIRFHSSAIYAVKAYRQVGVDQYLRPRRPRDRRVVVNSESEIDSRSYARKGAKTIGDSP